VTVVDTSLFIAAQRGRDPAKQKLDELLERPEDLAVSAMTILEVYAAPRMSAAWLRFYARIFEDLEVLDLDLEAAEDGARLARDMARRGFQLHKADAAIAGCAARVGASAIVTTDSDFTRRFSRHHLGRLFPRLRGGSGGGLLRHLQRSSKGSVCQTQLARRCAQAASLDHQLSRFLEVDHAPRPPKMLAAAPSGVDARAHRERIALRSHSAIRIAIFAISSPAGVDVSMPSSTLTKARPIGMSSPMNRYPLPAVRNERSPRKMTVSNACVGRCPGSRRRSCGTGRRRRPPCSMKRAVTSEPRAST